MNYYDNDIETVREALEKAHIALINLNTKYERNGFPKHIMESLQYLFTQHMKDGQYFVEKTHDILTASAVAHLVRSGYKVTDSEGYEVKQ